MKRKVTVKVQSTGGLAIFEADNLITLKDLKEVLESKRINTANVDILEGISNSILTGEDTKLPTGTIYRGNPTNDLILLLIQKGKKIASGIVHISKPLKEVMKELQDKQKKGSINKINK